MYWNSEDERLDKDIAVIIKVFLFAVVVGVILAIVAAIYYHGDALQRPCSQAMIMDEQHSTVCVR